MTAARRICRRFVATCRCAVAVSLANLMYPTCWLPNETGHTEVKSHISFCFHTDQPNSRAGAATCGEHRREFDGSGAQPRHGARCGGIGRRQPSVLGDAGMATRMQGGMSFFSQLLVRVCNRDDTMADGRDMKTISELTEQHPRMIPSNMRSK